MFFYSIKLGIMEDPTNKTRLSKLLRLASTGVHRGRVVWCPGRFQSSNDSSEVTSLQGYVDRMKEKQEHIYFIAGGSRAEVGFNES